MKLSGIILSFLMLLFCIFFAPGYKKHADVNLSNPILPVQDKPILTLSKRQAEVYIGIADRWNETTDLNNYSQWNYVRSDADG